MRFAMAVSSVQESEHFLAPQSATWLSVGAPAGVVRPRRCSVLSSDAGHEVDARADADTPAVV